MERCTLDGLRAVVVNSGNANAATGRRGLDDAAKMQGRRRDRDGRRQRSSGRGRLDRRDRGPAADDHDHERDRRRRPRARPDGDRRLRRGDPHDRRVRQARHARRRAGNGGTVRLSAQAKGAGMISPGFATLLVFVQSDAALSPETGDLLLGVTVKRSFERISVDGQLSPSDTVILQCSGESGVTDRAGDRRRAALRRGARRPPAPARVARRHATARAPAASAGWSFAGGDATSCTRRPSGRELLARQDRAVRR